MGQFSISEVGHFYIAANIDYWKISRTIRSVEDANKAIRDFRDKLRRLTPIPGDYITYKLNHEEYRCGIWNQKAIELAMLEAPLLLEAHMMLGMSPHTDCLSAVHEDMKLIDCNGAREQQTIKEAVELAAEIYTEADELLTVCHLFQQSTLRSREFFDDNHALHAALDQILDTQDLIDRRIRRLRDAGKEIGNMLEAA